MKDDLSCQLDKSSVIEIERRGKGGKIDMGEKREVSRHESSLNGKISEHGMKGGHGHGMKRRG